MKFENLTTEQKEKAIACKTPEEIIELARKEGFELTDEQLEAVLRWLVVQAQLRR